MIELFIIAFAFWVGYQLGVHLTVWTLRDFLREAAHKEGINIDEDFNIINNKTPEKINVSKLVVESQNGVMYLYNHTDSRFVCQGTTINELAERANKQQNIKYASVLHNDKIVAFIDGKVQLLS